jgi:SAM-dependent methyltransferase
MPERADPYVPGFADDAVAMMSARTAEQRAGFLLPLLSAGMRVLDVGCGPGTITLGLARAVEPGGSLVGVDAEPSQIELARAAAERAGAAHATFEVGTAYGLRVAGASYDVVFAHGLFEHLVRPLDALGELRRVLRPGGLAAICSSDWNAAAVEPRTADVEAALECHLELRRQAGVRPMRAPAFPRGSTRPGSRSSRSSSATRRISPIPRSRRTSARASTRRSYERLPLTDPRSPRAWPLHVAGGSTTVCAAPSAGSRSSHAVRDMRLLFRLPR